MGNQRKASMHTERYKAAPGTLIQKLQGTVPCWIWALMWAEQRGGATGGRDVRAVGKRVPSAWWHKGMTFLKGSHGVPRRAQPGAGNVFEELHWSTWPSGLLSSSSFLFLPMLVNPQLQWEERPQHQHAAPHPNSQKHDRFSCVPVLPKSL